MHFIFHNTGGLPELSVSIFAGQRKQISNQPPMLPGYKCHAMGQLVRLWADSPEEFTKLPLLAAWLDMCGQTLREVLPCLPVIRYVMLSSNAFRIWRRGTGQHLSPNTHQKTSYLEGTGLSQVWFLPNNTHTWGSPPASSDCSVRHYAEGRGHRIKANSYLPQGHTHFMTYTYSPAYSVHHFHNETSTPTNVSFSGQVCIKHFWELWPFSKQHSHHRVSLETLGQAPVWLTLCTVGHNSVKHGLELFIAAGLVQPRLL